MDQINVLKGYGKVTHLEIEVEDQIPLPSKPNSQIQTPTPKQKSLLVTAAISAAVLSTLIIGLIIIGAYIHNSNGSKSSNSADTIKIVCNVTRYPNSCFHSIISLDSSPEPDPEVILKLSLQVSLNELSDLSGSLKNLTAKGDGGAGLKDCESQIEDAIGRVNDSTAEMEADGGEKTLTERKIGDIQTWMSSAMTDQESCLDGLEEMDSTSFQEVKTRMRKSIEYVSNSLAIVANIHVILANFDLPLH